MVKRLIREESISRIELGGNNEPLLGVLKEITESDDKSLREVLKEFEQSLEREKVSREKGLKKTLEKQGISGSAVVPNINADAEWSRYVSEMREEFKERLNSYNGERSD
jgi:hypothetical protein